MDPLGRYERPLHRLPRVAGDVREDDDLLEATACDARPAADDRPVKARSLLDNGSVSDEVASLLLVEPLQVACQEILGLGHVSIPRDDLLGMERVPGRDVQLEGPGK